jgi:hypothetical protein
MKQTAFSWRINASERDKLQSLSGFFDRAREVLERDENSEVKVSYFPSENLIRFIASAPGEPPYIHILLCELEEIKE